MQDKRIIHKTANGGIAVIVPSPDCGLTIEQIAAKDVPGGVPYLVLDAADIPTDRTFRGAWDADFATSDGEGIGADAWFAEQAAIEAADEAERQRLAAIEAAVEADRPAAIRAPIDPTSFTALAFDGLEKVSE